MASRHHHQMISFSLQGLENSKKALDFIKSQHGLTDDDILILEMILQDRQHWTKSLEFWQSRQRDEAFWGK